MYLLILFVVIILCSNTKKHKSFFFALEKELICVRFVNSVNNHSEDLSVFVGFSEDHSRSPGTGLWSKCAFLFW